MSASGRRAAFIERVKTDSIADLEAHLQPGERIREVLLALISPRARSTTITRSHIVTTIQTTATQRIHKASTTTQISTTFPHPSHPVRSLYFPMSTGPTH